MSVELGVGVVYDAIESEVELGVTVEWSDGVLKTETKKSDESFIPKKKLSSQPFKEKRKGKAKPTITVTKSVRETRKFCVFFILPLSSPTIHLLILYIFATAQFSHLVSFHFLSLNIHIFSKIFLLEDPK